MQLLPPSPLPSLPYVVQALSKSCAVQRSRSLNSGLDYFQSRPLQLAPVLAGSSSSGQHIVLADEDVRYPVHIENSCYAYPVALRRTVLMPHSFPFNQPPSFTYHHLL
ncbi:hypothetical protein GALMADRAFT_141281 [Galerina marginata CBS 339.88]|uniref:Uncharacterized protein n=1 Tax=Galerina marginata (strain CBS 339.88) TaxID=685588 RepID=A0A067T2N0_GALM3|nr:hypothetical protein GALMADRAFT_141281 [Galerina marginata CBS 339.88]